MRRQRSSSADNCKIEGGSVLVTYNKEPLGVDSMAWYHYSKKLHEGMVMTSRFGDTVDATRRDGDKLGIPREWCTWPWKGSHLDDRARGEDMNPFGPHNMHKWPARNQEQALVVEQSHVLLADGQSHIVEASTGFGKTWCAIMVAMRIGRKTLVVVNKEDQLEAWTKEICKFVGYAPDEVGRIQQAKCRWEEDFTVAMVHSLASRNYSQMDYSSFGLIIFDEVHHMAAETFSRVGCIFPARLRLGISATVNRIDGKDFVFHGHIGQPLVQAKLIPMSPKILVARRLMIKLPFVKRQIDGEWRTVPLPYEAGKVMHILTLMAKHIERNRLIVSLIVRGYQKNRWTAVLSELGVEKHLAHLRALCAKAGIPDEDMAYYVGGMSNASREEAKTKRVVFCTYGMTSEATDVPWWDYGVFATPRANVKQAVGRFVREYPGKPTPVIADIFDDDDGVFHGYFKSRLKYYTSDELKGEVIYL